jgi:hypothetical protein
MPVAHRFGKRGRPESMHPIYEQMDAIYRSASRLVFASLIRLLGDFDLPGRRCKRRLPWRWSSGHGKEYRPIRARSSRQALRSGFW